MTTRHPFEWLDTLPPPSIPEARAPADVAQAIIDEVQAAVPAWTPRDSDPLVIEAEAFGGYVSADRDDYRAALLQCYPLYAKGANADQVAALQGVQREEGEDDANLIRRAILAPYARASVGTETSIRANCYLASANVLNVAIERLANLQIKVYLAGKEADADPPGTPSSALMATVQTYINHPDRKHISDVYTVVAGAIIRYKIAATIYYDSRQETLADITDLADKAAARFVAGQMRFGRTVYLSNLYSALTVPGADRVAVTRLTLASVASGVGDLAATAYQMLSAAAADITLTYSDIAPSP